MEEGNPVFSVYFCNEFNIKLLEYNVPANPKYIKFWGKLVE
jgi:hypothetical protein